jgi:hypothetical protein
MRILPPAALLLWIAVLAPAAGSAQELKERLRIFLDCPPCDFDYVRTELRFVDYVRDRADADVHVLVTSQSTGAGGSEYTLTFIGRGAFDGATDTLHHHSSRDDTPDLRRQGLTRALKLGLVRYAAATRVGQLLDITLREDSTGAPAPAEAERDPWNFWVFSIRGNGFLNGESQQGFSEVFGSVTANRVTDRWKFQSSVNGSYGESRYEVSDTQTINTIQRRYSAEGLLVRSIGPHLSAGFEVGASSSTFGNEELVVRFAPAIEYNFVPYSESTRRIFTLLYTTGVNAYNYRDLTIFGETSETRPSHSLTAGYTTRQPWGSISASLAGSQFLHDTKKYRLTLNGNTSLRLFRGLSLNIGGFYSHVRDQLSLSAEGATPEEILTRQRQLETSYFYFMSFGLSYQFGSAINNVVNPRIRSGIAGSQFF